jgi:hypothetical protein
VNGWLPEFREIAEDLASDFCARLGGHRIAQVLEGATVEQERRVPFGQP